MCLFENCLKKLVHELVLVLKAKVLKAVLPALHLLEDRDTPRSVFVLIQFLSRNGSDTRSPEGSLIKTSRTVTREQGAENSWSFTLDLSCGELKTFKKQTGRLGPPQKESAEIFQQDS